MPSTYTVNLGIEKPATGEQSGTWGDTTNVNFDIIDQAVNGSVRVTLTSAGTSGSPNDLNIVNGSTTSSEGRNKWIEIYSASDLGGSAYVRLVPNDAEKILFIRNSLAGSQSVLLFQGTYNASNDLEIPAGVDMVVKFDGAGASATVTDVFTKLRATEITTPTLTAGTADINGGSVDGATVGAASASTGAFTTLTASTSLNIASSTTVDGVLDEDNMASDSATKLATQQSIKAYVDSQVGTVDTLAEILANGNTSGANNLIIDSGQALTANTINETTAGTGVTIDSVLLKDDVVNATDIETSNISANDGTAAATIANSTGNFTITNFISNSVDIGGGAIDGTNIGASSAGTGAFTTLSASGDLAVDTNVLYVDTTNNRVGIGTASPNVDLELGGTGEVVRLSGSPTEAYIRSTDGTTNQWYMGSGGVAGLQHYVYQAQPITFHTTGTERTRIDSSGTLIHKAAAVFNEDGGDSDFRVESDANTHALFVDAGAVTGGRIGIKTSTPDHSLTVQGAASIYMDAAPFYNIKAVDYGTTSTGLYLGSVRGGVFQGIGTAYYYNSNLFRAQQTDAAMINFYNGDFRFYSDTVTVDTDYTPTTIALISPGGTTFNENGADTDFRVESDGNTHMLFVDAGNNQVHVATSGVGPSNFNVLNNMAITNQAGAQYLLMGNQDSAGVNNPNVIVSGNGVLSFGNGDSWSSSTGGTFTETFRMGTTEVVANEFSRDQDFRVESDIEAHALFVDGAKGNIGFGITPSAWGTGWKGVHISAATQYGGTLSYNGGVVHLAYNAYNNGTNWIYGGNDVASFYSLGGNGSHNWGFAAAGTSGNTISFTTAMTLANSGVLTNQIGAVFNESGADSDFRVESDTDSHALFLDASTSRVGINTSNPGAPLEVGGGIVAYSINSVDDGIQVRAFGSNTDANKLRLHNNGADVSIGRNIATYPGTWDKADDSAASGGIVIGADGAMAYYQSDAADTSPLQYNRFIIYQGGNVTVNESSTDSDFRVESDSNANMLVVDASANTVAVGASTSTATLGVYSSVDGTEAAPHFVIQGAASTYRLSMWLDGTAAYIGQDSTIRAVRIYSGAETAGVSLANGGTSWGTFSDERLKENVEPVENALQSLSGLRTVKYHLKDVDGPEDKKKIGVIAQDLVGVLDEVIDPTFRPDDDTEYMGVRYTELVPVLIKAIQEQQDLIESLTARVVKLESN